MSSKVTVNVTVKLLVTLDDEASIQNVIDEMEYSFLDTTGTADIVDTKVSDFDVIDSR